MLEYFGDPTATANTIVDGWIERATWDISTKTAFS